MFGTASAGRRVVAAAVAASLSLGGMAVLAPASAAPAQSQAGPPAQVLDRDMRGEAAINALGSQLPAVAAQNDMSATEFRSALRADSMLWVSRTGQLLFVDDLEFGPIAHDPLDRLEVPTEVDVLKLHSRTSTTLDRTDRVIMLDFDGHDARGTAWGDSPDQDTTPYDTDNDPGSFSDSERAVIYEVWKRVAEDYAPFNVDVTTEEPADGAINRSSSGDTTFGTRVVVTPSQPYACSCGGVAYVGVFDSIGSTHDYYQPAWVFMSGMGTGSAKSIAEAASHEAGHNLGLSHDGTRRSGYYTGHGDWAPIMGVGYYEPISQWSRGEYSGANNKEDDFTVIQANGGPLATDDWPSTAPLTSPVSGVIGSRNDVDSFAFTLGAAGSVLISARPATVSPNLDIALSIVDSTGGVVASADPSSEPSDGNDISIGLDANISTTLPAGSYTVRVDGVGWGDASSTGYSDYGSVGRYTLTSTLTAGDDGGATSNQPPTAQFQVTKNGLTVSVDASASTDPDVGDELSYGWDFGGEGTAGVDPTAATTSYTYASNGTYTITLVVSDGNGESDSDTETVSVKASKGGGRPAKVR